MTIAQSLGAWLADLTPVDVPQDLREKMRAHLLDTVGAAIIGGGRNPVRIAEQVFNAPGVAGLLIPARPRDPRDAARVNAIAAHAAEIDDTEGCDHTGAVVVPALLALINDKTAVGTGEELLTAMTAGYEVGRRMQNALGGYDLHNGAGWHSTATCGVFAATAAAARALRLDAAQCTAALAIAASSSAGGWAFATDGSMTKQMHVANAAGSGLQSALLARAGATGPSAIFEPVWGGFFVTHGGAVARPEALIADLGTHWHARHAAIKMYASCRSTHAPLDGITDAIQQGLFRPADVRRISIELSPFLAAMICPEHPSTVEAARMSLPISIALLLLGRPLDPDAYAAYRDGDVVQVCERIEVIENSQLSSEQIRVTVTTPVDNHVIDRTQARGSQDAPFGWDEVLAKFERLTRSRIGEQGTAAVTRWVTDLGSRPMSPFPELYTDRS